MYNAKYVARPKRQNSSCFAPRTQIRRVFNRIHCECLRTVFSVFVSFYNISLTPYHTPPALLSTFPTYSEDAGHSHWHVRRIPFADRRVVRRQPSSRRQVLRSPSVSISAAIFKRRTFEVNRRRLESAASVRDSRRNAVTGQCLCSVGVSRAFSVFIFFFLRRPSDAEHRRYKSDKIRRLKPRL